MSKNKIYVFAIVLAVFSSCANNRCNDNEVHQWIKEAPIALEEFHNVRNEIFTNEDFVKNFTHNGILFLSRKEVKEYAKYSSFPLLLKWFEDGRGYINIANNDTSFSYRECLEGISTSYGTIYSNRQKDLPYKKSVEIVDTMNLGNGWFAKVTKCKDCND